MRSSTLTIVARGRGRLIAAAIGLVLVAGCSKDDGPDPAASRAAYAKAQASFDRDDFRAARIDLLSALKADKDNRDARILFARVALARGDGVAAQTEIEKAIAGGYPKAKAQHLLANALLLQNNAPRALQIAQDPSIPAEFQGYAARMRGRALAATNRLPAAEREFTAATELSPRDPAAWTDLARYRIAQRDVPRAIAAVDQALLVNPNDVGALLMKGGVARATQGLSDALPFYNRIIQTDSNNIEARLERAATLGDLKREKEAKADIDHVLGLSPKHPLALYLNAVMEAKAGRWSQAQQILNETKSVLDTYLPAQMLQGYVALNLNNPARAAEAFGRVVTAQPNTPAPRRLLAFAQLRSNNAAGAVATLEPFTKVDPQQLDPGLLAVMGSAYAQAGRMKEAQGYLELSKKLSGNRAPVDTQLAMTKFAQGDLAGAESDLQTALTANPNSPQALTSLALMRLNERKYGEAMAASNRLIQANPKLAAAYNVRAAAALGLRDVKLAEQSFRQAIQINPGFSEARRNLAQLLIVTKRPDAARAELEALVKANPRDTAAYGMLAGLAGQRGQTEERLEYLRRSVNAEPSALEPRAALAAAYVQAKQIDKALNEATALVRTNPQDPRTVQLLAQVQIAAKQPAAAVQTVRTFSERNPDSAFARAAYARALRATGQMAQARVVYEEALKLKNPPTDAILVDLIQLEMAGKNVPAALAQANRLKARQPLLGEKVVGDIQMASGNAAAALQSYNRVYTQRKSPETLALLAAAQARAGRVQEAMATVAAYRKANPNEPAAAAIMADLQIARGDWRGAAQSYDAIRNTKIGQSPLILNNYAYALGQIGDKRAVSVAAQAYKAAPNAPPVQDTYGWLLVQSRANPKQGLKLLLQAVKGAPNDPGIRLHLAQAYRANGMGNEARQQLESVARGGPPYAAQAQQALAALR